jgi:hypothetical protein
VVEGRLTVAIGGKPSREWTTRFKDVIGRLRRSGSRGGAIDVSKGELRVDAVEEGSESRLRHSSRARSFRPTPTRALADQQESDTGADDDRSPTDQRMTDTFRSFAGGASATR